MANVLPDLQAQNKALLEEIAALRAKVETRNAVTVKVNALGTKNTRGEDNKGTISVYGINKQYPISLYAEQWERLMNAIPAVKAAIAEGDKAGTVSRRTVHVREALHGVTTLQTTERR